MFTGLGLVAFLCICAASLIGFLLRGRLPDDDSAEATQKTVMGVMNVVGLLCALVLGLLIAGAKANFDTRSSEVGQFAANLTLLDRELIHFGQEMKESRDLLRAYTARKIAVAWPARGGGADASHDPQSVEELDDIQTHLRTWAPQAEPQRDGRANALQLVGELKRTSRLLAVQQNDRAPRAFFVAVTFWLSMLYLSHALFAPFNRIVVAAMLVGAFSVSIALNLIFDTEQPFVGLVRVSSAPMQQALSQMVP